jgi:hypothetical protein
MLMILAKQSEGHSVHQFLHLDFLSQIADFPVTQIPAHTGEPHLIPGNKPCNFDLCVAFFRRVAYDLRSYKLVTSITHDKSNVGML